MPPVIPATNLNFGDGNDLDQVLFGIPCDADRLSDVNHLIDMVLGSSDRLNGQSFHRSLMNRGPGFPN